jgi:DNA-binding transcriptional regulator GbsR (MarR family)
MTTKGGFTRNKDEWEPNMSFEEIAEILGTSRQSVHNSYRSAIKKLKEKYLVPGDKEDCNED